MLSRAVVLSVCLAAGAVHPSAGSKKLSVSYPQATAHSALDRLQPAALGLDACALPNRVLVRVKQHARATARKRAFLC